MKIKQFIKISLLTGLYLFIALLQVKGQQSGIYEKSVKAPQFDPGKAGPVLFNQMTNPGTSFIVSHHFTTSTNNTETAAAADDFDVPAGETWDIWSVGIVGSYFQGDPGGGDTLNLFFMNDNNGKPGDTIQEFWAYTNFTQQIDTIEQWIRTYFDITLPSAVTLNEGTYWVSVQMYSDVNSTGKWGWMEHLYSSAIYGAEWHWINPKDGWGMGATDWTPASVVVGPWLTWELSFALFGAPAENDLSVKSIVSPETYYYGVPSQPQDVTVIIKNEGTNPQTGFDIKYNINGTEVIENIGSVTLDFNESYEFTFSQQVDLSIPGNYDFTVSTMLPGDEDPDNDSQNINIVVFDPTIYTMPSEQITSVTACSGTFTDAAGLEGDLIVDDWGVITFYPATPGAKMRLQFIEFDIGWSDFWIYDGEDDSAPMLGFWEDTLSPGTLTASYQNTTGALTVKFNAQAWTPFEKPGWSANISCHQPPENDFEVMKVESGYPVIYENDYVPLYAYVKNVGTGIFDKDVTFVVNDDTIAVVPSGMVTQSDTVIVETVWHPLTEGDYEITASVPEDQGTDNNNSAAMNAHVYPFDYFYEGFEALTFPPDGWRQSSTFWERKDSWPAVGDGGAFCNAPYGMFDTLYTPLLHITDSAKINFMAFSSLWWPGELDLVWIDAETGQSELIENVPIPFNWYSSFEIDVSVAQGDNYLGFVGKYNPEGGAGEVKLDEIVGDGIFRFYHENDLKAYILSGDITPEENVPMTFNIDIKNVGSEFQSGSEYTLNLIKENGEVLATYPGQDIDSKEVLHLNLDYTFTAAGLNQCYIVIDFADDQDTTNNTSTFLDVYVQQEGVEQVQIGEGTDFESNWFYPITTYSAAYYSQNLYLAEELGEPKTITGIMFYYRCEENYPVYNIPVDMWFSETGETNMSAPLEAANDYSKVFEGTVTFIPGTHGVYIPLDYVYDYQGGNLIVTTYKENNTPFLGFSRNGITHVADTMVRYYSGYNDPIDPYDQSSLNSAFQFHKQEFANAKFFKLDLNGQYCVPQTMYGTENGDFIDDVIFNEIQNTGTGAQGGPAYNDYTNLSANVERGRTYEFTVKTETSGTNGSVAAWIDFNGNKMFDDEGERILHIRSNEVTQEVTVMVTIPDDAALGLTILRVRNSSEPDLFASCEAVDYGETEDYSINIIETQQIYNPVTDMTATLLDDGNVDLAWNVPQNPGITHTEGFELSTWPPEGWEIKQSTSLTGELNNPVGGTWIQYSESFDYVYDGQYSAYCPDTAQNFNWLISPELLLYGNDEASFMLNYSADPNGYSRFYVMILVDNEWDTLLQYTDETTMYNNFDEPVSVDLSPFAGKNVRIAFVSQYNDAYPIAIDDIVLKGAGMPGKENSGLTGYEIYRNGELISTIDDPSVTTYSDQVSETESYKFCVFAVYDDGEKSDEVCDEFFYLAPLTPPVNIVATAENNDISVQWIAPDGGIPRFTDNFDTYNAGEQVACQNPDDWTTWTMEPCSDNDPFVTDEMAYSGDNSVDISGLSDLLYLTDELLSSGRYSLNFRMYIPLGFNGYFNVLQEHNLSVGSHWGMQVFFDEEGIGIMDAGGSGSATFSYDYDKWMYINVDVNIDSDTALFYIDGELIHGWKWSTGISGLGNTNSLNGADFYAWNTNNNCKYFMDDFQLIELYEPAYDITYNLYRDGSLLTNTDETHFQDGDVIPGYHEYCVTAVYSEGESEEVCDYVTIYSTPENFTAELIGENDVHCTWDIISGGDLSGYYVYRDGEIVSELLTVNEWTDTGVEGGTHTYYVTASYSTGESLPSNTVTLVILITPKNLTAAADGEGNIVLNWDPVGEVTTGEMIELYQHDGVPNNGFYEWFDFGYGSVFDLSSYPDATIEMADFFHQSWGVTGTWSYMFHIIDWATLEEIGTAGPFQTTGDDQWEVEIPMGSVASTGGQIGVFMEPLSNDPQDAYPVIAFDEFLQGFSIQISLNDLTQYSMAGGDFLLDLWIWNPLTKQKEKVKKVRLDNAGLTNVRKPYNQVKGKVVPEQKEKGGKALTGYNIYHSLETNPFELIDNTIDTTYTHMGAGNVNGAHYYYITAQYEEGESMHSDTVVEVISGVQYLNSDKLTVYPNPVSDIVRLSSDSEIKSIVVINTNGQIVINRKGIHSKEYQINIKEQPAGLYNIRIENEDGWISRKILKN